MPRLKQVTRAQASGSIRKYYDQMFGDRDPVTQPGTATGTPGNWWTVFALVPHIFDHATNLFGMVADKSTNCSRLRRTRIMRVGFTQRASSSTHTLPPRRQDQRSADRGDPVAVSDAFSPADAPCSRTSIA
jgi:hypothetical protein